MRREEAGEDSGIMQMQSAEMQIDPFAVPMVFFRIGWMDRYEGLAAGDEIKGGGSFVETNGFGYEIFNFKKHQERLFGYVTPKGMGNEFKLARLKIERLGASSKDQLIPGVLAVWLSPSPRNDETVVIG